MGKISKSVTKEQTNRPVITNDVIGFEWNVTSNYFNSNNSESDSSDEVRLRVVPKLVQLKLFTCINYMIYSV